MKKVIMTGLVCLSVCMPLQVSAQSLLERVVTEVILGVYDRPQYRDGRPYYVYNNQYYYGGDWRDGYYYYDGRRLSNGRYYERGYYDQYNRVYDQPHYRDESPYYFYNNRYYYGGDWRDGYYYYKGKRLRGGHYYERGYPEQYRVKYKKPKHPNYKNGYYKNNKHYTGNDHRMVREYDDHEKYRGNGKSHKHER